MRVLATTLFVALAIVAAGCGGSSSTGASGETTEQATGRSDTATQGTDTGSEGTTETTETTKTDVTTTEDTATTPAPDENALADILGSEECASLIGISSAFAQAAGGAGEGLEQSQKLFEEFAAKAPEDIRDDFAVIAEAWTAIVEVYADAGISAGEPPDAEAIAKLQQASEELGRKLDDVKFQEASQNISTWVADNCTPNG